MPRSSRSQRPSNRYQAILERIFFDHYSEGTTDFEFVRSEIGEAANALKIDLPKNVGDVVYAIRYRTSMSSRVLATQPEGQEWIIEGAGRSKYRFRLVTLSRIVPRPDLVTTKIPDATPELIGMYALDDEQAVLAKLRYNRLIDIFLGITSYSLQSHLRTSVTGVGQIEIDELYFGIDRNGSHYVVPVQAKGGKDQISVVQTKQDILCCAEKFPGVACRPISAQFLSDNLIAMFELTVENDEVKVVDEKHYRLVPADQLDPSEITTYRQ